jgi:acetyl-CoA carboxylase biotin carboxyl carrier protein
LIVKSPTVGVFYRASAPDAKPFVEVGDVVSPSTTLCIIEVMKLMNSVDAQIDGTVLEILVGNAEPVEYGQPLFVIRRGGKAAADEEQAR